MKLDDIRRLMKVAGWGERMLREMAYQTGAPKCRCGRPRKRVNAYHGEWADKKMNGHDVWNCFWCLRFEHVGTHDRRYEPCYKCLHGRDRITVARLRVSHAPGHCTNCGKAKIAHQMVHGTMPQAYECGPLYERKPGCKLPPETRFTVLPGGNLETMCTHRLGCKDWCLGVYHDFTADGIFPIEQDHIVTEGAIIDDLNGETATANGPLGVEMLATRFETR